MPCFFYISGKPLDRDEYSVTSFRNIEDLSSSNRAGVSNSATRPTKKVSHHELLKEVKKETLAAICLYDINDKVVLALCVCDFSVKDRKCANIFYISPYFYFPKFFEGEIVYFWERKLDTART